MQHETIETIKVKPTSAEQGEYFLINANDFDSEKHQLLGPPG